MLKRLFFLAFLTLGLMALTGLMVVGGAETLPAPQAPIMAVYLPDQAVPAVPVLPAVPIRRLIGDTVSAVVPACPLADANGIPVCTRVYYHANYLAFCFSDRAG